MKIKLFLLLLFFSNCYFAIAQEDDELEVKNEMDSEQTSQNQDMSEAMRLKKGYALGDGLTLESASTWLNFTQSLQLLAGVSSTDNFDSYSSEFNIRRARFNFRGTLFNEKVYVRLRINLVGNYQSTTTGSRSYNNTLQDALVEYRPSPNHRINFGVRANYDDSREARIEGESLGFIERSAISTAFDPIFDYGIRYYGIYRFGGNVLKPYVSITTGDGTSALQKNYGGFKYGIRLDYLPFGTFSKGGEYFMDDLVHERVPKLIIGPTFSYNDGISSAKGTNGGRYIYGDAAQNELLPDLLKTGIDYMFKYRGWYSLGEYVYT
ncbi:MAG: porin, partial [Flavobacterium nitrogenifigens]